VRLAHGADPSRRARHSLFIAAVVLLLAGPAVTVTILRRTPPGNAGINLSPAQRTMPSPVPAPGQTGAAVCTDPQTGTQWRVSWKATGETYTPGTDSLREQANAIRIVPMAFASRPVPAAQAGSHAWSSRDKDSWNLRWTPSEGEAISRQSADLFQKQGSLADLALVPLTAGQSPRYVSPDGGCTVFVTPYLSGPPGGRTVAVLGDSLVAQLYASADGMGTSEGTLQQKLEAEGYRPEINGQAGRRWTPLPGTVPGIVQANSAMLDEIRGLREAQSVVLALGVNDAGWVALSPDPKTYSLRMAWVLLHMGPVIDELRDHSHCTVLVTISDGDQSYLGSAPGTYQRAASQINAYLAQRASEDPNDRLQLWDWGSATQGHHTFDPEPWFGRDTIHLNQAGQAAYAAQLSQASQLC
jgi:lysophospholipase L1-like esterase